jgi:hypothetical protein
MNKLLACSVSGALLAGCAGLTGISPEYPKSWPPLVSSTAEGCPDLSGRYKNLAIYSYLPNTGANDLAFRLVGESPGSDTVILGYSPGTLRVESVDGTGGATEKILSESNGDFACSEGAFVLPTVVEKDADGTGGYRSESRLYLRPATGGSLIGEERTSGIGAVGWLVPVAGWQVFWYQWHPED